MNEFVHTTLGFCFWDIPALIVLIIMAVVLIGHMIKQNKREKDFEDELSDMSATHTTESEKNV